MENFTFSRVTSTIRPKQLRCCWRHLFYVALFIVTTVQTGFTLTAQNIRGTVPVLTPIGGFGVDGDAYANTPTPGIGDWFYSAVYPGTGGGLIDADMHPLYPTMTYFLQDDWGGTDATIFTASNKINDNPSTYTWGPGNVPNKNEMQNLGVHFAYADPSISGGVAGDLWCIFAADREVTNGDAYIDFEFLQKSLTMTAGGFATEGTQGGRTVGDLLVTVIFTNGGTEATVEIRKWQPVTGGYAYLLQPNSNYVGSIYVTVNHETETVPFDVYGTNPGVYKPNQWAEGAVNLTQLLNFGANPCSQISTVFVRTKTSQSISAELKDFPGLIQLDLNLIPEASVLTTNLSCNGNTNGSATITITGGTPPYQINFNGGGFETQTSPKVYSGLAAGTYTWAVKDANDCDPSGSFTITEPDALDLVLTPTNASCFGGAKSISAAVTGTPLADLEINIDGGAYANVTASPVVFNNLTAANHIIIVRRKSDNTCMVTKDVTLTQPDALDLVLTPTNATCFGGAKFISAAVTGTPLADLEINIDGGAYANVTASPVVFNNLTAANHIIIVRRKSDNTCMVTKNVTLTQPDALDLALNSLSIICEGDLDGSISATVTGTPLADLEINIDGGTFANVTASPVIFNGLSGGNHDIMLRRISDNTCMVSKSIEVVEEPCYEPLCSYTQGYYGNPNGSSCDGENTFTTAGLIEKALDYYPGDVMRIGAIGHSILIAKTMADINKVIEYLPGGKTSYELSAGDIYISNAMFKTLYTTTVGKNNTTINNALLAQTIVLGLNIGINSDLGDFALMEGTFATAELLNGCGSTEVVERVCVDGVVYNEYEYYTIMGNIAAAASNVNELFALANRALGNVDGIVGSEDGISLNNIASAVDKINNAFDGCRMFMGYGIEPLECGIVLAKVTVSAKVAAVVEEPVVIDSSIDFKVYPVPFEDIINVSYRFEYDTDVTIQVFNLQGGLIYGVVDNMYNNGEVAVKQISLPGTFDQALIVRLTTNKEKLSKTIVAKSSTQK